MTNKSANKETTCAGARCEQKARLLPDLVDYSPEACILIALDGCFLDCNSSTEKLFGMARNNILGKSVFELGIIDASDMDHVAEAFTSVVEGAELSSAEFRILHASGDERIVSVTAHRIDFDGDPAIYAIVRDITADVETAKELLDAAEQWQRTFDSLSDGVSIHGLDGKIAKANKALANLLGSSSPEELIGKKCCEIFHSTSVEPDKCSMFCAAKTGKESSREYFEPQLRRWLSITITPLSISGDSLNSVVHVVRDITSKKAAEQALVESERRYRSIVEHTSECICNIDLEGNFLYMSPTGLKSHALNLYELRTMTHLELAEPAYHGLLESKLTEAKVTGKAVEFEYESETTRGVRWFSSTLSPMKDGFGTITSFIRVSRDIQQHKNAEDALLSSESRFRSVFEKAGAGMALVAPDCRFLQVNSALCKFFQYDESELLSLTKCDLTHEDEVELDRETLVKVSEGELPTIDTDRRYRRKNGSIAWGRTTEIWIRESDSAEPYAITFIQDITEQKHAEESLAGSLDKMRETLNGTIKAMALTVEARDPYTSHHQQQVALLARAIAEQMQLPAEDIEGLYMAALVHDVGKLYVPAEILNKPGALNEIEYRFVKTHATITYEILRTIDFQLPVAQIAYQHHERLDGSGYPLGLRGGEMLLCSKILAVADVVNAMASHRPYRPSLGITRALEEISAHRGSLFDATAVDTCIDLITAKGFDLT